MKSIHCACFAFCVFSTTATAATFPSVYEPRRLSVEEGVQILGPVNSGGDDFGGQVAPIGDINGDSLMDFAIGWVGDPGNVIFIYGSPSLASTQIDMPSIESTGTLLPGRMYITAVGDFNGDGLDDWVMTNYYHGTKLVLGRREANPSPLELSQLEQGQWGPITSDGVEYGYLHVPPALVAAGDINGDGYDDLIAWRDEETMVLLQGRPGLLPDRLELLEVPGDRQSIVRPRFLVDAYRGGDINGDGYADVLFSNFFDMHVVFGSANGFPSVIDLTQLNGINGFSIFDGDFEDDPDSTRSIVGIGGSSAIMDDITGDGLDDLLIATRGPRSSSATRLQLLPGHTGSWKAQYTLRDPEFVNAASFEATVICGPVNSAGDINSDGVNDWLVGLCDRDTVVYGRKSGTQAVSLDQIDGIDGFQIKPTTESDWYGPVLGAGGDVNGDGLDDLLLGSPQAQQIVSTLDDLIDQPYQSGQQRGMATVVFGRLEIGAPATPHSLYPALAPELIQLRWKLAPQQISALEVHRDGALIATLPHDATGYVDTTAKKDVRHTYEVLAVDATGVRSPPLVLSVRNDLDRYPEISGEVYSSSLAEIFWTYEHLNYDIYRDGELVDSEKVSSWLDRGYDSTGHTYYVEAEKPLYESYRARSALLTLPENMEGRPPAPVDDLRFALYSGNTLELFWERAGWGEAPLVYEIARNDKVLATIDGASWMDYNIRLEGYEYTVTTIDANGRRSRAQPLSVSIYEELPKIKPTMPDKLVASVLEDQSIELVWERSSIGTVATGFRIYRDSVKLGTTTGNRFIDSDTAVNTTYRYEVVAYNDVGQTSEKARVYASVDVPVAPEPPASASALAYGSHTVEIFWSRVTGRETPAARYELYRDGSLIETLDALSYMDRDVMPGTRYEYAVRSVSALGLMSADAASASVTTPQ